MKIYQNLGINERDSLDFPSKHLSESIAKITNAYFMKGSFYGKKKILALDIKLKNGSVGNWGLLGRNIYSSFLKEMNATGLTKKQKLSKLENKEIITTITKGNSERIVGIRPIRPNEGYFLG
jgi:hypothetical protein